MFQGFLKESFGKLAMGLYREFYFHVRKYFQSLEEKWEEIVKSDHIPEGVGKYGELFDQFIVKFFKTLKPDGVIDIEKTVIYSGLVGLTEYTKSVVECSALVENPRYDEAFMEFKKSLTLGLNDIIQKNKQRITIYN